LRPLLNRLLVRKTQCPMISPRSWVMVLMVLVLASLPGTATFVFPILRPVTWRGTNTAAVEADMHGRRPRSQSVCGCRMAPDQKKSQAGKSFRNSEEVAPALKGASSSKRPSTQKIIESLEGFTGVDIDGDGVVGSVGKRIFSIQNGWQLQKPKNGTISIDTIRSDRERIQLLAAIAGARVGAPPPPLPVPASKVDRLVGRAGVLRTSIMKMKEELSTLESEIEDARNSAKPSSKRPGPILGFREPERIGGWRNSLTRTLDRTVEGRRGVLGRGIDTWVSHISVCVSVNV